VTNVALSPTEDLAVIETRYLPRVKPLAFATAPAQGGDTVIALGYGSADGKADDIPRYPTWTSGSVDSIDDETVEEEFTVTNAVVHEATMYPGDSGGPLLDIQGQVVGVNDARRSDNRCIAIPASTVRSETGALIVAILDATS
jgi:S1-C subfamily serine protease